ncbi:MAG TPA: YcxB family protein [Sphingomicrobium sp.]|nr:YcxB family protein [Sphingomicrobium sp.]
MSGTAIFELTDQDQVDAVHAHTGRIFGKLAWALLFVALLFPLLDLWAGVSILEDTAFWVILAVAVWFLVWDWFARDWMVRRAYRQGQKMRSPNRLSWDERTIRFESDAGHVTWRWEQFYRWLESKKVLLLYRDSQTIFPIPVRALPEGAVDEMIAALKAAGVREKGRWR